MYGYQHYVLAVQDIIPVASLQFSTGLRSLPSPATPQTPPGHVSNPLSSFLLTASKQHPACEQDFINFCATNEISLAAILEANSGTE